MPRPGRPARTRTSPRAAWFSERKKRTSALACACACSTRARCARYGCTRWCAWVTTWHQHHHACAAVVRTADLSDLPVHQRRAWRSTTVASHTPTVNVTYGPASYMARSLAHVHTAGVPHCWRTWTTGDVPSSVLRTRSYTVRRVRRARTRPYTKIDQLRRGALASGTTNLRAPRRLWSILNLRVHTGSRSTNSDGEVCSSGTMIDQLSPGGFVQADAVLHAVCPLCARIAVSRGEVCSSGCSFVHDRPTLAGSLEIGTTTRRCSPSTLVDLDETGAQGCARFKIDQLSRGAVPSGTTNPSVPRRSWSILNGTARGFKIDQNPQGAGRLVQPLVGAPCESWSILMAPATQVRRLQHPYGDSRRLEKAIELRTLHDLPPVG